MSVIHEVIEALNYDPYSGLLTWKKDIRGGKKAGQIAGHTDKLGYLVVKVGGRIFKGHRLAWIIHHGGEVPQFIDHINGDPSDNRIQNLRPSTHQQNMCNRKVRKDNSSGFPGVCAHRSTGKWQASIRVNGKRIHLGTYKTPEEAHQKYIEAAKLHHGEFVREFHKYPRKP
ncbi:MAG: HNH endonuclease [Pantoea sp.]|jgi:hypothetical protein|uniref:HNH endonuclease n=1 Tax=Pantoea sp. TaxID=69393 RepID=UPI00257EC1CD|nr:HNH endonuclease [Pantoea sp.]MBS6034003.1 HNH endonuclease [Pantoea sp.]